MKKSEIKVGEVYAYQRSRGSRYAHAVEVLEIDPTYRRPVRFGNHTVEAVGGVRVRVVQRDGADPNDINWGVEEAFGTLPAYEHVVPTRTIARTWAEHVTILARAEEADRVREAEQAVTHAKLTRLRDALHATGARVPDRIWRTETRIPVWADDAERVAELIEKGLAAERAP